MHMELVTIGAFARAARLSPKALRLYDELGLLPPAAVDADTGYRYYDPAQLDRARLVAWLRRLDMPLARIRSVCSLPAAEAAAAIATFMAEAEAELAARSRLATFLTDYLTGKGAPMPDTNPTLGLRFATGCEIGKVRETNQDFAYAASTLLAVADGAGPHGAEASVLAVNALRTVPTAELSLEALTAALHEADATIRDLPGDETRPITTLTALIWSGTRIAVAHIGDTRAYLLRSGHLSRFTDDHSYAQHLVDTGNLPPGDLLNHPRRALLMRALGSSGEADLSLRTALPGDRYLLCTDGLWTTVPRPDLQTYLETDSPQQAVDNLLSAAHEAGAPDNIACVVADVVPA
ncbi:hypothetical protein Aco04nite_47260 [Winogradskya consettensis]|uniref:Uncharacterized protein n=2 Tax=Winogradskya consettensis TaxID=113560 RepID=A0A919W0R1_9ACTN|nr:hypothetical protein Aco04nite_47260 [Actinoplanes consettensis]